MEDDRLHRPAGLSTWPGTTIVLSVCLLTLSAGFLLKDCTALSKVWNLPFALSRLVTTRPVRAHTGYRWLCYSDIRTLYTLRRIGEGTFPYVHGSLQQGDVSATVEYPVLTGLFMWVSGRLVSNADHYYRINALLLAPCGLFVAYLLARLTRLRALLWAAAPGFALYAFHNWDLLAVAAAMTGLWLWRRGRPDWAGVFFGLGGAFKLYPLMLLAPLVVERVWSGDQRGAMAGAAAGIGAAAAANLPIALLNPSGWFATYEFHRLRGPNIDSIWMLVVPSMRTGLLNLLTLGLIGSSFLLALLYGSTRVRRDGRFPFFQVSAAMITAFLLWNKVHSPQYVLWLLPFFALTTVPLVWWAAYAVTDGILYVSIFAFARINLESVNSLLAVEVTVRALLLLGLYVAFLRSQEGTVPDHPDPTPTSGRGPQTAPPGLTLRSSTSRAEEG